MQETYFWREEAIINKDSISQLLSVVHYAHDTGGKKILLVNHTIFSERELLVKIEEAIPEKERERTMPRIRGLLFFSTDLALTTSPLSSDKKIDASTTTKSQSDHLPTGVASLITLGLPKPPLVEPVIPKKTRCSIM